MLLLPEPARGGDQGIVWVSMQVQAVPETMVGLPDEFRALVIV